jgi:ABC-type hemin transport system substrate-binding protein
VAAEKAAAEKAAAEKAQEKAAAEKKVRPLRRCFGQEPVFFVIVMSGREVVAQG